MFRYNRRLGVWLWHFNRFIWNTLPCCRIAEVYLSFLLFAGLWSGWGIGCVCMSCSVESGNHSRLWAKWTGKLLATWSSILLSSKYPRLTTGEHMLAYIGRIFMQRLITVSLTFAFRLLFAMLFLRIFKSCPVRVMLQHYIYSYSPFPQESFAYLRSNCASVFVVTSCQVQNCFFFFVMLGYYD